MTGASVVTADDTAAAGADAAAGAVVGAATPMPVVAVRAAIVNAETEALRASAGGMVISEEPFGWRQILRGPLADPVARAHQSPN